MLLVSIGFTILGAILTLIIGSVFAVRWTNKAVENGHFASARYDKKNKTWKLCGQFGIITSELRAIQEGRKPGAIKYVD